MVLSARKFGSLYGYEVNGDAEVDLESANTWARSVLNDYKQLEESARRRNHFELIDPEALATLAEYLYDACEYELPTSFPSNISATGQTEAQQSARRAWIITWLEGLIQASATSKGLTVVQAFKALPKCKPTGLNPDGTSRYLPGDVMKLNRRIKTVEKGFTPEELAEANPTVLRNTVKGKVWLDKTRAWLDSEIPAVEDDDTEFKDTYKELMSRFAKLVHESEKSQLSREAVSTARDNGKRAGEGAQAEEQARKRRNQGGYGGYHGGYQQYQQRSDYRGIGDYWGYDPRYNDRDHRDRDHDRDGGRFDRNRGVYGLEPFKGGKGSFRGDFMGPGGKGSFGGNGGKGKHDGFKGGKGKHDGFKGGKGKHDGFKGGKGKDFNAKGKGFGKGKNGAP